MGRSLSIFSLAILTFFPLFAMAAPSVEAAARCNLRKEIQTDFGCFPNDPVGFVQKFYRVGLSFIGGISLITLIIGGYDILTSKGRPDRVNIGKSYIFYSIAGLLLAIFGFVFIQVVLIDVLRVPGFK